MRIFEYDIAYMNSSKDTKPWRYAYLKGLFRSINPKDEILIYDYR